MYSYTFGKKNSAKQNLVESDNRVVIRTKNARKLKDAITGRDAKIAMEKFNIEVEFPDADVTVIKSKEEGTDQTALRDSTREILKKEEELRFAGRVLVDPETKTPTLYTENIFVKFFDSVKSDTCEKIIEEHLLTIKQKLNYAVNSYFVGAPENTGSKVFEIAEQMLNLPEVEFCHPELIRKKGKKTIHPLQWHLRDTTIHGKLIHAHCNIENAHQITLGENITIAIIDDGVDINNPEFNMPGKIVAARNIISNSNDPKPRNEDDNHGTACAGVAAASGIKASGVAPAAKILPIRNMSELGSIYEANAFYWAVNNGADIISCSWGPEDGDYSNPHDPVHTTFTDMPAHTRLAIEFAIKEGRHGKGCVILFAAGNGNEDVKYDNYASNPNVIAVAACNDTGKKSVYSDYGDAVWCCFPSSDWGEPDMQHPEALTKGIYTTDRTGGAGYNPDDDYCDDFGGTSSACPGVAGIAALILAANPDLSAEDVKFIIKESCEIIDSANGNYNNDRRSIYYGYGKPDAEKAVKRAIELKTNTQNALKIFSALVNPQGADHKQEKISLLNTSVTSLNLNGWKLDVKNKFQTLSGLLGAGETTTINLNGGQIRLANTGATIRLINPDGVVVQEVTYTKEEAKKEAAVIIF